MLGFTRRVWELANVLRGTAQLKEVRNIVLAILYLKFEAKKSAYDVFLGEEGNPLDFKWSLKDAMMKAEERNHNLENVFNQLGVFDTIERIPEGLLRSIQNLTKYELSADDLYLQIFDELITLFSKSEGRFQEAFNSPEAIKELFKQIVREADVILNPACGIGSLLESYIDSSSQLLGQEINIESISLAKLRFAFTPSVTLIEGNSLSRPLFGKGIADAIVLNPPFNQRFTPEMVYKQDYLVYGEPSRSNANMLWLQLALYQLKDDGKAVILLSNNSLFSGGQEGRVREKLISDGLVECIITLPSGLFAHTSIPTSIWVLNKSRSRKDTLMVDLSNDFVTAKSIGKTISDDIIKRFGLCYRHWLQYNVIEELNEYQATSVSIDEIGAKQYDLSPSMYLQIEGLEDLDSEDTVELRELISRKSQNRSLFEALNHIKRISIKNLSDKADQYVLDIEDLENHENDGRHQVYEGEGLLIARNGDKLKPTYLSNDGNSSYALLNVLAFHIDEEQVSKEYLIQELHQDYVKYQLMRYNTGSAIRYLKEEHLLRTLIKLPSLSEQERVVQSRKLELIKKAKKELVDYQKELGVDVADANSFLRHQIAGTLKNLRGAVKSIKAILNDQVIDKHPEILNLKVSPKRNKTLGEYLDMLSRDVEKVSRLVRDSNKKFEVESAVLSDVDILKLVRNYVVELKERESDIDIALWLDEEDLSNEGVKGIIINGNEELITVALDNLVENALKHGFNGCDVIKRLYLQLLFSHDSGEVQLNVSNTGNPVEENFDMNLYIREGGKVGLNAGDGVGGSYVSRIMKKHAGRIEYTDEQGSEGFFGDLVTTFEMYYPIKDLIKDE